MLNRGLTTAIRDVSPPNIDLSFLAGFSGQGPSARRDLEQTLDQAHSLQRDNAFLIYASRRIAETLHWEETIRTVTRAAIPHLGDWCFLELVSEGGKLRRGSHAFQNPAMGGVAERVSALPRSEATDRELESILATGKPMSIGAFNLDWISSRYPVGEIRGGGIFPLKSRGRQIGLLVFLWTDRREPSSPGLNGVTEEYAERVSMVLENSLLHQEFKHAIQMRDDFVSVASHELKSPVSALRLQVDLLQRLLLRNPANEPTPIVAQTLRMADSSMRHLQECIDQLFDVTRIRSGNFELHPSEFDIMELVQEVCVRHSQSLQAASCEIRVSGASVRGFWDRFRIGQVLVNLITNAIKYAPGLIEIRIEDLVDRVAVQVRDHGLGLSPEKIELAFDRFERLGRGDHKGLGLGLFIVKTIVTAHQGEVTLQSRPGAGSSFGFILPKEIRG